MAFDAILWAKLSKCAALKDGKVPAEQLPSYIDEVVEVASYANLPQPGSKSKIYYTLDTKRSYRWGSTRYIAVNYDDVNDFVTADDLSKFVTEDTVKAALSVKADDVPFTENYVVGLPDGLGGFKADDSLKDLTLREILIQLLKLSIADDNDEPDEPGDSGESANPITPENIVTSYVSVDGQTFSSIDNSCVVTDHSQSGLSLEGVFEDDQGNVGYQLQVAAFEDVTAPEFYIDPAYRVTDIQLFDYTRDQWVSAQEKDAWIWEESPKLVEKIIDGKPVQLLVYTYFVEAYDAMDATPWRFIVEPV